MPKSFLCREHGEAQQTVVCAHLSVESLGQGFHCEDPAHRKPYLAAWCGDCEIIRAACGGWDRVSADLYDVNLICPACFEHIRIRNIRPAFTLDHMSRLRWKSSSLGQWHTGPRLHFAFSEPYHWDSSRDLGTRWSDLDSGNLLRHIRTFLNSEYCAIDGENFFVRGVIPLPIVGTEEFFRWGVWGALSRENFRTLLELDEDPRRAELKPMASWLGSRIADYPDTLNLKMYAQIRKPGKRPLFRLERCDHPLVKEFYEGITPERVKEIMCRRLPSIQSWCGDEDIETSRRSASAHVF